MSYKDFVYQVFEKENIHLLSDRHIFAGYGEEKRTPLESEKFQKRSLLFPNDSIFCLEKSRAKFKNYFHSIPNGRFPRILHRYGKGKCIIPDREDP